MSLFNRLSTVRGLRKEKNLYHFDFYRSQSYNFIHTWWLFQQSYISTHFLTTSIYVVIDCSWHCFDSLYSTEYILLLQYIPFEYLLLLLLVTYSIILIDGPITCSALSCLFYKVIQVDLIMDIWKWINHKKFLSSGRGFNVYILKRKWLWVIIIMPRVNAHSRHSHLLRPCGLLVFS